MNKSIRELGGRDAFSISCKSLEGGCDVAEGTSNKSFLICLRNFSSRCVEEQKELDGRYVAYRERKTTVAEESRRASVTSLYCTECVILGASETPSKAALHDYDPLPPPLHLCCCLFLFVCLFKTNLSTLFWIFCMRAICSSVTHLFMHFFFR